MGDWCVFFSKVKHNQAWIEDGLCNLIEYNLLISSFFSSGFFLFFLFFLFFFPSSSSEVLLLFTLSSAGA